MKNALIVVNTEELREIFREVVFEAIASIEKTTPPEPFIKGIHELANFLRVSPARAQKLKNEGVFPFWQDGRTLLFDPEKVREAMINKKRLSKYIHNTSTLTIHKQQ